MRLRGRPSDLLCRKDSEWEYSRLLFLRKREAVGGLGFKSPFELSRGIDPLCPYFNILRDSTNSTFAVLALEVSGMPSPMRYILYGTTAKWWPGPKTEIPA